MIVDSGTAYSGRASASERVQSKVLRLAPNRRTVAAGIFVFLGYFLGARIGFALTFQPHPVSVMWPPNALLVGVLLLTPPRIWWFLLLCALPAHLLVELQSRVPFPMVLCWFLSNTTEALIGAVCIRLIAGPSASFGQMRGMTALFLGAGLVAPALSSFLDAAFVSLNHFGHQGYWEVWRMRLCSNIFAELTLVPAIVSWSAFRLTPPGFTRLRFFAEGTVVFLGLLAVSLLIFFCANAGPTTSPALLY